VRLAAWLKEKGIPIRVVTYPGAHHGFDRLRPVAFDRNYVGSVRPSTIWIRFHLTQAALIVVGLMGSASATTLAGAFNAEMRTWMGAHGVARSSLAVMRDGRLVHVAGFGDRGASERVGVWSLSKAITATCVATLARDNLLSLADPICPLLSTTFERNGDPEDNASERALYYVKGGAAWIENRYSFVHDSVNSLPFFITERDSANASRWGWMVGTGFEYALSKNVSAFVEYDYLSSPTQFDSTASRSSPIIQAQIAAMLVGPFWIWISTSIRSNWDWICDSKGSSGCPRP
jgi:hypothetical protein